MITWMGEQFSNTSFCSIYMRLDGFEKYHFPSSFKGWSHAFPGENLPEPIQIAWQSVKDNALYVFRGILLASIYLSLALSEALRLGFVDDLSGGSAQGVVRFAIFNASVLAFLIVLSMVGVTYFGRRKSRKEKKQASDSSSFPSESIYSSSLGELSIFKQTGQPEEFLNESTSQMVSTESSEKGSTKNSEKRSHKSNEKSGSISNSPASTELPREATPSSNESSKRKKTIKEDEEQEEDGDKEDEQDGNEEPEEQSAQVSKSKKRGNGSKSGSDSKSGSGSKNRNKSNSESGGGSHFQSAKGSQGDEDLDKLENNGNDSVYETETATQTRKSTGSQNRKSQKASGSGSITKTDSGSGSKTKAGSGSGSKTKIGSGSKRDQDLSGSEKSYDEEPADSEASKNQTGPVSQESNKRSGSCSKGSRKRRRSGSRSSRSRTPTVSGSKNESTQDSNCTKCTEIERKKKEQESKAAGRGQTMPQNELSGQRESKPNIFEHYNQKVNNVPQFNFNNEHEKCNYTFLTKLISRISVFSWSYLVFLMTR